MRLLFAVILTVFISKVISQETKEKNLECIFKYINFTVTHWSKQYSCQILSCNFNTDDPIKNVSGQHASNLKNGDVMQFVMDYTATTYLPTNLYDFLPNLKLLAVRSSGVEFIKKVNFKGFKNFQYLSLSDNNLKIIPSDTFTDLSTVVMINLRKNLLETLPKDLFKNNILLKTLHLEANRFETIQSDMFDHLEHLESVDLSHNFGLNEIYYKNDSMSKIQKSIQNDLDNLIVLDVCSIELRRTGSNVKNIITIVLIIIVLALFLEFTCFIHKLKATNKVV